MTHLNPNEFHAHRTSCLNGAEFPCHEALPPEPYDAIFDNPIPKRGMKGMLKPRMKPDADFEDLCLLFGLIPDNL